MPEIWVTVTQSQVFNWIKKLNSMGIQTDCVSITDKKLNDVDKKIIEESINGQFHQVYNYKKIFISDIVIIIAMLKFYLTSVFKYEKIIFQTRINSMGVPYALLRWLPKAKFIFEARGVKSEEEGHVLSGQNQTL